MSQTKSKKPRSAVDPDNRIAGSEVLAAFDHALTEMEYALHKLDAFIGKHRKGGTARRLWQGTLDAGEQALADLAKDLGVELDGDDE